MFRDSSAVSIAVVAVILAGCGNVDAPGSVAVSLAPAARSTSDASPLHYSVQITNSLRDPLTFTLTPGEHAALHGQSTFELQPHWTKTVDLTIGSFVPERLLEIKGSNASHSQTLGELMSIACDVTATNCVAAGGYVGVGMHGLTGMDERITWHSINGGHTWVTALVTLPAAVAPARQALPRRFSALPTTDYSVKLNNDLAVETLKVSIKTSSDSTLSGPASFLLDPSESRTVKLTGPDRLGFDDLFRIVDEAQGQVVAKLALLKEKRDNINISDMFEMQMSMNHLSQLSEMSVSLLSAANTAIASMARNVKS